MRPVVNDPIIPQAQHTPDPIPSPLHRTPPSILTIATSSHANPVDNDLLPLNDGSHQSIPSPTSAGAEPSRHPPTVGGFPTAIFMKHSHRRRLAASTGRSIVPHPMRSVSHSTACSPSTNRLVRRWLKGRGIYRVPVRAFSLSLSNMPLKNAKSSSASSIASLPSRTNVPVLKPSGKTAKKLAEPAKKVLEPIVRPAK